MTSSHVTHRLTLLDVDQLVGQIFEHPIADDIWTTVAAPGDLVAVAESTYGEDKVRFIAILILFQKDRNAVLDIADNLRAAILVKALAGRYVSHQGPWGELWASDDTGMLGQEIVATGKSAAPYLLPMLDDITPRSTYLGDEEATALAMRGYRLKDFAAFYLSKIFDTPLEWVSNKVERDARIEGLRKDWEGGKA